MTTRAMPSSSNARGLCNERNECVRGYAGLTKRIWTPPVGSAAGFYAMLGMRDEAFAALSRGIDAREFQVTNLNVEPNYAPLKNDPRFAAMLTRMGLAK